MMGRRIGAIIAAGLVLVGCASPSPPAGEAEAIRIAKDRCSWTKPFQPTEHWHAALHDGHWHVWLSRDRDPMEPVVGALDIWIRAKDGNAGLCNHA
jgi:hypothetical protein